MSQFTKMAEKFQNFKTDLRDDDEDGKNAGDKKPESSNPGNAKQRDTSPEDHKPEDLKPEEVRQEGSKQEENEGDREGTSSPSFCTNFLLAMIRPPLLTHSCSRKMFKGIGSRHWICPGSERHHQQAEPTCISRAILL